MGRIGIGQLQSREDFRSKVIFFIKFLHQNVIKFYLDKGYLLWKYFYSPEI